MATTKTKTWRWDEISPHSQPNDCWIVIQQQVYDVTDFLSEHPGGANVILNVAGKDATSAFSAIHSTDVLKILPESAWKGEIDKQSISLPTSLSEEKRVVVDVPPMERLLNVFDFEAVAQRVMKPDGWAYYSSGADDEVTLRENHQAFQRIWLKPRVMVNVKTLDTTTHILGHSSAFPLYISATALGKLAHPDGEVALTRAAHTSGVIQMLPTLASCTIEEMTSARQPGQVQFFQLYVNSDRAVTQNLVQRAERLGCQALFITVDAPYLGRREKDMRHKFMARPPAAHKNTGQHNQGTARAISTFIDPSLSWTDLTWFRSITKLPIVLKGIQCVEDALLAVEHGVAGIVLSNHGGRQLDFSRSAIEILPEVMDALRRVGADKKLEVYIDGGVRRGSDIFKALALGAKAVGIGRPTLYGLAGYGQAGVERVLSLLKEEFEMVMRLMGTPTIADIKPSMLLTKNLADHFSMQANDYLSSKTYMPLEPISKL